MLTVMNEYDREYLAHNDAHIFTAGRVTYSHDRALMMVTVKYGLV